MREQATGFRETLLEMKKTGGPARKGYRANHDRGTLVRIGISQNVRAKDHPVEGWCGKQGLTVGLGRRDLMGNGVC